MKKGLVFSWAVTLVWLAGKCLPTSEKEWEWEGIHGLGCLIWWQQTLGPVWNQSFEAHFWFLSLCSQGASWPFSHLNCRQDLVPAFFFEGSCFFTYVDFTQVALYLPKTSFYKTRSSVLCTFWDLKVEGADALILPWPWGKQWIGVSSSCRHLLSLCKHFQSSSVCRYGM